MLFILLLSLWGIVSASVYPLTSIPSVFSLQYSYDATNMSKHVSVSKEGMLLSVYPNDKAHAITSPTLPRTEILVRQPVIYSNQSYTYSIDQKIITMPNEYEYCFMQIIGDKGPNVLLRWSRGQYQLITRKGNIRTKATPNLYWTNWRIEFKLQSFVKVYRNNSLFLQYKGSTGEKKNRVKFGVYSQVPKWSRKASVLYKNFKLFQSS